MKSLKIANSKINQEVKEFIKILKKRNISIKQIILFGSFAKKNQHKDSDIDLAVISHQFGRDEIAEMMLLKKLSIRVSDRIEPIPLSEEYLKSKYHPLIGEIKKYGKTVYTEV